LGNNCQLRGGTGSTEEVARHAAFVCSDDAASITGGAQVIDGG
jgi:NAD(P)-dependent dehydrogenase (short-subunit alcohol dehydrogenase family)